MKKLIIISLLFSVSQAFASVNCGTNFPLKNYFLNNFSIDATQHSSELTVKPWGVSNYDSWGGAYKFLGAYEGGDTVQADVFCQDSDQFFQITNEKTGGYCVIMDDMNLWGSGPDDIQLFRSHDLHCDIQQTSGEVKAHYEGHSAELQQWHIVVSNS